MTWQEIGITNYRNYFKTDHWKGLKSKWITRNRGAKCYVCGKKNTLLLHHSSYENLGNERLNRDVYVVCFSCHQRIHYILWFIRIPLFKNSLLSRMYYLKSLHCLFRLKPFQAFYYICLSFKSLFLF